MTDRSHWKTNNFYFILVAVFFVMVGYSIPWSVAPGASLSLGANDLAEWASLHPEVRASSPSLLVSLLLRLPLGLLAWIVAFRLPWRPLRSRSWWLGILVVGFIVLLLLPPLEFFTSARGDKNYQQQIALVIAISLGSAFGLSGMYPRVRGYVVVSCAVVGAIASGVGFQNAYVLLKDYKLPVQVGSGVGLTILMFVLIAVLTWQSNIKQGSAR